MKSIYRPAAAVDIGRAYAWYENERKGLGEEFLIEVNATARLVLEMPETYPVIVRETRRDLVHRSPYGLFYRVLGDTVAFVACFPYQPEPRTLEAALLDLCRCCADPGLDIVAQPGQESCSGDRGRTASKRTGARI